MDQHLSGLLSARRRDRAEARYLWKKAVFCLKKNCIHISHHHTYCERSYFDGRSDFNRKIFNGNIYWQNASNCCIPIKAVIFEPVPCKSFTFHVFRNSVSSEGKCRLPLGKTSLKRGNAEETLRGWSLQASLEGQPHLVPLILPEGRSAWEGKRERFLLSLLLLRPPQMPQVSFELQEDQNCHKTKTEQPDEWKTRTQCIWKIKQNLKEC